MSGCYLLLFAAGIFGALYCLADSHTEFTEVSKQLKEVAELLGSGLIRQLTGPLAHEYLVRTPAWCLGSGPGCIVCFSYRSLNYKLTA